MFYYTRNRGQRCVRREDVEECPSTQNICIPSYDEAQSDTRRQREWAYGYSNACAKVAGDGFWDDNAGFVSREIPAHYSAANIQMANETVTSATYSLLNKNWCQINVDYGYGRKRVQGLVVRGRVAMFPAHIFVGWTCNVLYKVVLANNREYNMRFKRAQLLKARRGDLMFCPF